MRLLEIQPDGSFSLTKDQTDNANLQYAILSHTWGEDDDEVTFEDLTKGTGVQKRGYYKILFCTKQAMQDGLQYVWVDTCCINKSKSSEESEAINSMFSWYKKAAKCYVLLTDVLVRPADQIDQNSHVSWELAFRKSRWFTRGWTLQELIAPKIVEFYTAKGHLIGDKSSLLEQIHEITGIAAAALRNNSLSPFSPSEIMSWAKNRETKRQEDSIYSLWGLFDVYMSPIYGEGRKNALRRLGDEIYKRSRSRPLEYISDTTRSVVNSEQSQEILDSHSPLVRLQTNPDLASYVKFLVQAIDSEETQVEKYHVQLNADKQRLKKWADALGISNLDESGIPDPRLLDHGLRGGVKQLLSSACELFQETGTAKSGLPLEKDVHSTEERALALLKAPKKSSLSDVSTFPQKYKGLSINRVERFKKIVDILYRLLPPSSWLEHSREQDDESLSGSFEVDFHWQNQVTLPAIQQQIQFLLDNEHRKARENAETVVDDWLDVTNFDRQFSNRQQLDQQMSFRLDGTCEWIFDKPEYQQWESDDLLDEGSKFLWIYGPPGYGKSVTCAHLVHHFQTVLHRQSAFFFSSVHATTVGDPVYIIRSWISQLALMDSNTMGLVYGFREHGGSQRKASNTEIWSLFESLLIQLPQINLFLDGLDEYPAEGRAEFLNRLKQVLVGTATRLLITSRDKADIRLELSPNDAQSPGQLFFEYGIRQEDVKDDIGLYSKSVVDRRLPKKGEELRKKLASHLTERSDGMFLWVKMHQDQLHNYQNGKRLERIVADMPSSLRETYQKNLDTILHKPPDRRNRALAILHWTTFALRPLTVLELSEALLVQPDGDELQLQLEEQPDEVDDEYIRHEIIDICMSLVEIRVKDDKHVLGNMVVHLVHPSVREFLSPILNVSSGISLVQPFSNQEPEHATQHTLLTRICLAYLGSEHVLTRTSKADDTCNEHPFFDYVVNSWHLHLDLSEKDHPQILVMVKQFFCSLSQNFSTWANRFEKTRQPRSWNRSVGTPLYYAALFSLTSIMETIWDQDKSQLNRVGGQYGTPLQAACARGNRTPFELLIAWGADPNIRAGEFGAAIIAAASGNQDSMIMPLIKLGAQLECKDSMGRTAVHKAAQSGHCEVLCTLLEQGANTAADSAGWAPIKSAAYNGHLEVVRLLLDRGVDATTANSHGWTPMNTAASKGHLEVVRLLLDRGVDATTANSDGWTPMNTAASEGYLEVVRLLLDRGVDATAANNDGWTPINAAASEGHLEVVRLLLDRGVDATTANSAGWTPINSAASQGHLEVVRLLLDRGVDATTANSNGWTLLHFATEHGKIRVLQMLVETYNADPTATDLFGRTPLHFAAAKADLDCFEYLLHLGLDCKHTDRNGNSVLYYACAGGSNVIVQQVLDHDLQDLRNTNTLTWTLLHWACRKGEIALVEFLLEQGLCEMSVSTENPSVSWTPGSIARYHRNPQVESILESLHKHAVGTNKASSTGSNSSDDSDNIACIAGSRHGMALCDGCLQDIYGTRFHCCDCVNFDLCFMCYPLHDKIHSNHSWEVVDIDISD